MRHLNKDLWLLYASNFLFAVGMGLYNSLWPAYIRQLGGTPVNIGLIAGIGGAIGIVFAIPAGLMADRFERRAQILWGWIAAIPVPVLFALAGDWRALIPGQLLLSAGIIFFPAMQAYIMEKAPPGRDAFVYSFVMSSFPLGSVLGPPIGGWLADRSGIKVVFWAVTVLWTLATLASVPIQAQRPRRAAKVDVASSVRGMLESLFYINPSVLRVAVLFAAVFGLQSVAGTFVTPYLQDVAKIDLLWIGVLGATASLGAALGSPVLGWLADRQGKIRILGVAQLAVVTGFGGILVAGPLLGKMGGVGESVEPWMRSGPFLLLLLSSLARGIGGMSLAFATAGGMVPAEKRGRVFAVVHLANGLGLTFGPYIGGYLYERNPDLPFLTAVVSLTVVGVVMITGRRWGVGRKRSDAGRVRS